MFTLKYVCSRLVGHFCMTSCYSVPSEPNFNKNVLLHSPGVNSGKCYKQEVLTPMLEKRSYDSVLDSLPHTVTLISMPSAANGKRGLSVSVLRDVNGSASVQVKE